MPTEKREQRIKEILRARQSGFVVVLEDVSDPHNVAAVVRSAEAFGISEVWLVFGTSPRFNPKRVGKKSSSSGNKWVKFRKFNSTHECIETLQKEKYEIVATALRGNTESLFESVLDSDRIALWFGNEHSGLSEEAINAAHKVLILPMRGMVESLNISVSAGIMMYEVTRQRMSDPSRYALCDKDVEALFEEFKRV